MPYFKQNTEQILDKNGKFWAWHDDDTNVKKAAKEQPSDNFIIIEIFKIETVSQLLQKSTGEQLIGKSDVNNIVKNWWPIAKVLNCGKSTFYKNGDIVKIRTDIENLSENPDFWDIKNWNLNHPESPRPEVEHYIGDKLETLMSEYGYKFDPLAAYEKEWKFWIPTHVLQGIKDTSNIQRPSKVVEETKELSVEHE